MLTVDATELKEQFEQLSKEVTKSLPKNSSVSVMISTMITLFKFHFSIFEDLKKKNNELNDTIQVLVEKLANNVVTVRKRNDEALNGNARRSEKE